MARLSIRAARLDVARGGDGRALARASLAQAMDRRMASSGDDVDVGQARHAGASEQAARPARLPDDRGVDDGAGLDGLERVDLHARLDDGLVAHEGLVAEDHALLAAHPLAQIAGAADDAAVEADAGADVAVVVDDGALEVGVVPDADVGAEHAVRADDGAGADAAVVADERRSAARPPSGSTSAPSPNHTPGAQGEAADLDVDLARRGCPGGRAT